MKVRLLLQAHFLEDLEVPLHGCILFELLLKNLFLSRKCFHDLLTEALIVVTQAHHTGFKVDIGGL